MSSQDDEPEYRVVALVLISVVVLAVGLALGIGIHKSRGAAASSSTAVVAAPAAAVPAAAPVGDDASVVVENGVVKFYFASGKADLAAGALDALGEAIAAAKAGKKLVLSGFHDTTGDPAFNAELAKQRAIAVRNALVGAGVAEGAMELRKPEQTAGTGNNAEARRVEVMIAP
jgi:outer membrane protein OmpA-like peptidoglycan-associated protein